MDNNGPFITGISVLFLLGRSALYSFLASNSSWQITSLDHPIHLGYSDYRLQMIIPRGHLYTFYGIQSSCVNLVLQRHKTVFCWFLISIYYSISIYTTYVYTIVKRDVPTIPQNVMQYSCIFYTINGFRFRNLKIRK